MASNLHRTPDISPADVKLIAEISDQMGLEIPEAEYQDYADLVNGVLASASVVNKLPPPKPEVAFPRTPGYRPEEKDNPYNAWYIKTDIKGSASGVLAGKRIAIKDNIAVAGVTMMNGCALIEGHVPDYDATVVTRILKAGGTIAGKSVCENLCFSGNSFTSATGPVLNPADPTRSTGGSSSGSAALVAGGEVDMAIGGDQGGSIRLPSSWCGIVGLKPTFSLVPYTGAIGIYPGMDHLGPMARTVTDCATLLQVIAGPDPLDPRQHASLQVPDYLEELKKEVTGLKIGLLKEGLEGCTEEEVVRTVREAAGKLTGAGCTVEEVSVPFHKMTAAIFGHVLFPAAAAGLEAGGVLPGTGGWHDVVYARRFKEALKLRARDLSTASKFLFTVTETLKRKDGFTTFAKAENLVPVLRKAYEDVLEKYDVLIMPTTPYVAPKLPEAGPLPIKEYERHALGMVVNTSAFNITGHPALSINAGFAKDTGLPVGMMIVGKHFQDSKVLRIAKAVENTRGTK